MIFRDPIDVASDYVSNQIKKANPEETTDVETMSYALSLITNMFLTTFLILAIGKITDSMQTTIISLITFAFLRFTLKGFHLKSMTACVLLTTSLFSLVVHVPLSNTLLIIVTILCVVISFMKSTAKPAIKYPVIALIAASVMLQDAAITLGCLAQALTLIPVKGGE